MPSADSDPVRLICVGGVGHSGTSAVRRALLRHPGTLRVHGEPHLVETIASGRWRPFLSSASAAGVDSFVGLVDVRGRSSTEVADSLVAALSAATGASVVVEKTPLAELRFEVLADVPGALGVHVLRDVRGVAASYKVRAAVKDERFRAGEIDRRRRDVDHFNPLIEGLVWRRSARRWASPPAHVVPVRFEDVVVDAEASLRPVAARAGLAPVPPEAAPLRTLNAADGHAPTEWPSVLTRSEQAFLAVLCGRELVAAGYPVSVRWVDRARFWLTLPRWVGGVGVRSVRRVRHRGLGRTVTGLRRRLGR